MLQEMRRSEIDTNSFAVRCQFVVQEAASEVLSRVLFMLASLD